MYWSNYLSTQTESHEMWVPCFALDMGGSFAVVIQLGFVISDLLLSLLSWNNYVCFCKQCWIMKIAHSLNSQKTPQSSPSWVSYGESFVSSRHCECFGETDCVTWELCCICWFCETWVTASRNTVCVSQRWHIWKLLTSTPKQNRIPEINNTQKQQYATCRVMLIPQGKTT